MRSDFKKLDFFTLEMSKNHLIRNFLRDGRLRVNRFKNQIEDIDEKYAACIANISYRGS